jgi:TonB-dependent receptor
MKYRFDSTTKQRPLISGVSLLSKKKIPLAFALSALIAGFSSAHLYAQSVTGELTDSKKAAVYEGAKVSIESLKVSTTTDNRGRFRLQNIPAGTYILSLEYLGAPKQEISIVVPEEGLMLEEVVFGNASGTIEEVLVYGQTASLAGALNQQRSAENLKSVLDADSMGQFPDQNVAEALRRLSGVSVEGDQGEGRYVVVRGLDPDLNSTSINGVRATSAENRRALQLDVVPSDVLDGLEVQKSLTPDLDGDAIGGSINVKTLSAFSRKGAFLKVRAEGGYNEKSESWSPKGSIAGSNIFTLDNGKRLGLAGALSWGNRKLAVDNNEANDWTMDNNGEEYFEEFEPRYYNLERERIGAVFNIDYDLSDETVIFARSLYSRFNDAEIRDTLTYKDLELLSGSSISGGVADIGYTEIEVGSKDRDQTASNLSLTFGSESQWDVWGLKTSLAYNYAEEDTPNQVESVWVSEFESGTGTIPSGQPVLSVNMNDPKTPRLTSDYFDSLRDASNYELDEIEFTSKKVEDTQWAFQVDVTRDIDNNQVQFGAKVRQREKENGEYIELYSAGNQIFLSDNLDASRTQNYGFPNQLVPVPSLAKARALYANGTGLDFEPIDSEIDSNANDWIIEEDIYAAYGMYKYYGEHLTAIAGVRVEYTDFSSQGNLVELYEEGSVLDGSVLANDTTVITAISADKTDTSVLPSLNLRYDLNEQVILRGAISRAVVRPGFEAVASRVSVEDNEAEVGNPDLNPFQATNFDVSAEYYPTDLSVMSAGIFYKKINDFIFEQTFEDFSFLGRTYDEITISQNGDDATLLGLELNYQQALNFLPSPFDGLLVNLNYTYVDGDASVGGRDITLPKQSQNLAGFTLGYDKYGFDARLALKYRGKYLDEIVEEGFDRYTDSSTRLDFTVKYRASENLTVYAELSNLNDEPEYYYSGNRNRLLQYDEFGTTTVLGVQYIY